MPSIELARLITTLVDDKPADTTPPPARPPTKPRVPRPPPPPPMRQLRPRRRPWPTTRRVRYRATRSPVIWRVVTFKRSTRSMALDITSPGSRAPRRVRWPHAISSGSASTLAGQRRPGRGGHGRRAVVAV